MGRATAPRPLVQHRLPSSPHPRLAASVTQPSDPGQPLALTPTYDVGAAARPPAPPPASILQNGGQIFGHDASAPCTPATARREEIDGSDVLALPPPWLTYPPNHTGSANLYQAKSRSFGPRPTGPGLASPTELSVGRLARRPATHRGTAVTVTDSWPLAYLAMATESRPPR